MAWHCSGRSASELLANLLKAGLLAPELEAAWAAVDRAHFVPRNSVLLAYQDTPLALGHGATISAPHMHASMLTLLQGHLTPGASFLDVGSGTGIMLALAAQLVCTPGGGGRAVGIEHIAQLAEGSLHSLQAQGLGSLLASKQVQVVTGDGRQGWAAAGPYSCIHVGAASPTIPPDLLSQLAPLGRLVIPVGVHEQDLLVVDKAADGSTTQREVMGVRFVPLCSRIEQEEAS
jgi:protein-L-isoaspartate(D-aspartate) O-methyltransferase